MFYKLFYKSISNIIYNFTFLILNICNIEIDVHMISDKFYNLGISNHVSELDVFILYVMFLDKNFNYKWIADERLKDLPILGSWAKENNTIFISRTDKTGVKKIKKYVKSNDNIFMFPEGTLFYKQTISKSKELCKKLNIKSYKNVLCPKIHGFTTLLDILKPKYITNITLDYIFENKKFLKKSVEPLKISNIYMNPPKKIIITVDKIKVDPKININDIFREKDILLNKN